MKKSFWLLVTAFLCVAFEAQGDVVVGIHGFLTNSRALKTVKSALQCAGLDVYLWNYPSRQKCIEEHACDLVVSLQQIACQCPGRPIHFVTHSIGALVLRAALNMPGCPEEAKIGRAVLLAPPNQGSCLARRFSDTPIAFAMGDRSGWELMHYDACKMLCFGEFPPTMRVLVIAGTKGNRIWFNGPNDGFIAIEETRLNTPFCFLSFPVTHGNLLTIPAVLCSIRNFLCS
jgi:hypothetical protein